MKLLICQGVCVGDVVLATSILPALKKADPTLKIGFMVGSWAREVVTDHRYIDWVHLYDHPLFNRSMISRRKKKKRAKAMKRELFSQIKAIGYDAAIQLSSLYAGDILFQAGIPRRISHLLVEIPYFFNELIHWELACDHIIENHKRMLGALGINDDHLAEMAPVLEYKTPLPRGAWEEKLPKEYFLVHMGTGEIAREWPLNNWKELAKRLSSFHLPLVFVGKGEREKRRIQEVIKGLPHAIDLSDQLSFRQLLEVVRRASFVVGLESLSGHLTAAFKRPGVFIYAGYVSPTLWRPYSSTCHIIAPKECDPVKGSTNFLLVRTITPDEVEKKVKELFASRK